jgi:ceramide glucosyltransferase
MFWLHFFWVLGVLLLLQSVWSLIDGYKYLNYLRLSLNAPLKSYHPPAALIVPCKGLEADLQNNLEVYLSQDYPDYQVVFAVSSEDDPACALLRTLADRYAKFESRRPRKVSVIVAGYSETHGEKVHNLTAALTQVDPHVEVLAFADSDARPRADWLRALVSPLSDPSVTVSTGFRWYMPSASFASRIQAAWDSVIATTLGGHQRNIAWGGSMAMRAKDFRRMKIAEKYWQGTVSDDYAVAQAVRDANGYIRFEPCSLVSTEPDNRLRSVLRWTNRQIVLTRVYAPRLWLLGMASYSLYALGVMAGVAAIAAPSLPTGLRVKAALLLATILGLGAQKGWLRAVAAKQAFPDYRRRLAQFGGCYVWLTLVTPWIMLCNFAAAAFIRTLEWRGTVYRLESRTKMRVLRRSPSWEREFLNEGCAEACPDDGIYSARG